MVQRLYSVLVALATGTMLYAQTDTLSLQEVVVTGTRNAVDVRHLPMTVIDRKTLTCQQQTSVLPTVIQQVPSLFVTSRSMMGYGVSTGAAGDINLRGENMLAQSYEINLGYPMPRATFMAGVNVRL